MRHCCYIYISILTVYETIKLLLYKKSSGVGVKDEAVSAFQDLKLKKKYRYISYKITADNKEIEVEKSVESSDYDGFVASLPANECRYCVYDFQYEAAGGEGTRNKILFYTWSVSLWMDKSG